MRTPAVPRSLASVGAKQGSPEAREVYLQFSRRETLCCSSLARSCSVQAAHQREEKSPFVRVKWAGKPEPSAEQEAGLEQRQRGSGCHVLLPGQGPPSPPKWGVSPSPRTQAGSASPLRRAPEASCPHTPHHTAMALGEQPPCTAQLGSPMATESHCPLLHDRAVALGTAARPARPCTSATSPGSCRKTQGEQQGLWVCEAWEQTQECAAGKAVPHVMGMAPVPPCRHCWGHEWHTVQPAGASSVGRG